MKIENNFSGKRSGIYIISNSTNDKKYVGSAVDLIGRYRVHKSLLSRNIHFSKSLQNYVNKYGIETLEFSVHLFCEKGDLIKNEQFLLDKIKPFGKKGFNTLIIANSSLGLKRSKESIQKSLKSRMENGFSEKISKIISKKNIGNKYMLGKKHSEETKKVISLKRIGFKHTEDSKNLIRIKSTGRVHSQESKNKIKNKLTGNKNNLGNRFSESTKKILSDKKSISILQFYLDGTFLKEWKSSLEASDSLKISQGNISMCLNNKRKSAGGFIWKKK